MVHLCIKSILAVTVVQLMALRLVLMISNQVHPVRVNNGEVQHVSNEARQMLKNNILELMKIISQGITCL